MIIFSMKIEENNWRIHLVQSIRYFWKKCLEWISNFSNFSYEVWSIWGYHHKQHTPPHIRKHKHTWRTILRYKLAITRTCSSGLRRIPTVIATGIIWDFIGHAFPRCILIQIFFLHKCSIHSYILLHSYILREYNCVIVLRNITPYKRISDQWSLSFTTSRFCNTND